MKPTAWLLEAWEFFGLLAAEASVIVAGTALAALLCSGASRRRTVWQIGFLSLGLLSVAELTGAARRPLLSILQQLSRQSPALEPAPVAALEPPELILDPLPEVAALPEGIPTPTVLAPGSFQGPSASESFDSTASFPAVLGWIWLSGTALLLLRIGLVRLFIGSLLRRHCRTTDFPTGLNLERIQSQLGFRSRVRFTECARIKTPIVFGVLHPTLAVPAGFNTRFTPDQQRVMLAHELVHLAGRDPLWQLVSDLVVALLWWHPIVWWARAQLRQAMEMAADEASLLIENGPALLAECLVQCGARLASERALPLLGIGGGFRSQLGKRVHRLLHLDPTAADPARPGSAKSALLKLFVPLAAVCLILSGTAFAQLSTETETEGDRMNYAQIWRRSLGSWLAIASLASAPSASMAASPGGTGSTAENLFQPGPVVLAQATPESRQPKESPRLETHWAPSKESAKPENPVEQKLLDIVLDELDIRGLPLSEVLKDLSARARKLDAEGKGINFIMVSGAEPAHAIDPVTGGPMPSPEPLNIRNVSIDLDLPLRNVRLKDALDVIVRVAEAPIQYTIEEYGVLFSPADQARSGSPRDLAAAPAGYGMGVPPSEPLQVGTFLVNETVLRTGLEQIFENPVPNASTGNAIAAMLLESLGIEKERPNLAFYNPRTGVLMVRAAPSDLDLIAAALKLLGGTQQGGDQKAEPKNAAGPAFRMSPELMQRYGLIPPESKTTEKQAGEEKAEHKTAADPFRMNPELMKRYGLIPSEPKDAPAAQPKR